MQRVNADTGEAVDEAFSYRALQKLHLTIGACTYYAVLYRTDYVPVTGDGYATELHFIPDLGISLLYGGAIPGQPVDITYKYLSISAEAP